MSIDKQFLDAVANAFIADEPTNEVVDVGHKVYEFLKTISDDGTADRGIGMGCYDLWVTVGGKETFIQIQKSKSQQNKEAH